MHVCSRVLVFGWSTVAEMIINRNALSRGTPVRIFIPFEVLSYIIMSATPRECADGLLGSRRRRFFRSESERVMWGFAVVAF